MEAEEEEERDSEEGGGWSTEKGETEAEKTAGERVELIEAALASREGRAEGGHPRGDGAVPST